jgi:hypothetical protein
MMVKKGNYAEAMRDGNHDMSIKKFMKKFDKDF